jgi:hypothetical protein
LLFHHDPDHDDKAIDALVKSGRQLAGEAGSDLIVDAAAEGMTIVLGEDQPKTLAGNRLRQAGFSP